MGLVVEKGEWVRPSTLASGWGSRGEVHSRGAVQWALWGPSLQGAWGPCRWTFPECSPRWGFSAGGAGA